MSSRTYVITACLAVSACTPTRHRTADDTIVMAIETPATTADPRYTISNFDSKLSKLIAPGLTSVDTPTTRPRMELADRIERVDDHTVDVVVKPGARFSDGSAVLADDVVRTYRTTMDPACDSVYAKGFHDRFTAIEAVAPDRVRFHLVRPLGTFVTDIEYGIVSFHGVAAGECHVPRLIGAGPYVLRALTSTAVYLDANPNYPDPPRVAHVEIRFVKDAAARLIMLVGGSLDLLQNAARMDLVDDLARQPRVRVDAAPSVILTYMLLNTEQPMLRDLRVREAIALAIDRPALIAAELGGRAVLATGLLPPSHWAYEADVARWPHDPARARALLDEAGFRVGLDGTRMHLVYKTSSDAFRITIARLLAAQLREVGIDVEVRPFEFATFFADIKKGNYQLASMQTSDITEPDFYHRYFHSSEIPDAQHPDGGNRWRYRNPELDRLLEAGRAEMDFDQRKPIYAAVQRIVARDLPIVPLWHEHNIVLSNVDVTGYEILPNARLAGLVHTSKGR
jgi:peptide/nickel transport system substrate-binding protein